MTRSADATFFAHSSMAKFETGHLYACLFDHIRQGQNRIRQIVSCRLALNYIAQSFSYSLVIKVETV